MCRLGLTDSGNIVVLTFDRQQPDAMYLARFHTRAPMLHHSPRQRVTHENRLDGLQIKFGCEVHHREILIVELAMLLRGVAISLDEMQEQLAVCLDVPVEVHADESMQLQKTGIHVAHESWIRKR